MIYFVVAADPNYDPKNDSKKPKKKKFDPKDLASLKHWLARFTNELKFMEENKMVWADAFTNDKNNFYDFQQKSITNGWNRWCQYVLIFLNFCERSKLRGLDIEPRVLFRQIFN